MHPNLAHSIQHLKPLGQCLRPQNRDVMGDDVFVPQRTLIGTERSGWALNRNVLN